MEAIQRGGGHVNRIQCEYMMQSPFYFLTKPVGGKRYNNTKKIGGIDLIVSTSEEDHRFANREAEVVSLPLRYAGPVRVGDILLVHHNTFKIYNDIKGNRRSGRSFFRDDIFMVDSDQFFMYKQDGEWRAHGRYCFVKPIAAIDSYIKKNISNEPLMGEMVYPNEWLISVGINKGDIVGFLPETEYEYHVDGERMFRMFDAHITMKLNG